MKKRVSLFIEEEVLKEMTKESKKMGISRNTYIKILVYKDLEKKELKEG